jgi:His-Xaa-Ser system radical SAM maturase HxsB
LPFRFGQLAGERYVVTNDVGEYVLLDRDDLVSFAERRLHPTSDAYRRLKAKHFLFDEGSRVALDLLALKYRTRLEPLAESTGLHIFVVTLRCDHSCHYCQVSRQNESEHDYDMTRAHADKALALAFRSPSACLKLEFQGGEPLLNFDLVKYVIERARTMNECAGKQLQFVIASNLSRLTDDVLTFCKVHGVYLSTSLDGPADLHDVQRRTRGGGSHARTLEAVARAREALGHDAVAALMTTTPASLGRVEEIVDEYVRHGFSSIFLRSLSPYGFAAKTSLLRKSSVEDWIRFYKAGLAHVLRINKGGYPLREEFATILLRKVFSPSPYGYVDLQSPAGLAIGAIVYNYDGSIYASDEGRMLAEMGDTTFRLGHLDTDSYESVFLSETLLSVLDTTMPEGSPMCSDCPFLPYCGADPVFHKATQGDVVGHKAFSDFCRKQKGVLSHLIETLEEDSVTRDVMMGWI